MPGTRRHQIVIMVAEAAMQNSDLLFLEEQLIVA